MFFVDFRIYIPKKIIIYSKSDGDLNSLGLMGKFRVDRIM
jgi:hypothetical protein